MARPPVPKKCRDCAINLLSKAEALRVHGPDGDNCWAGKSCQDRRARLRDPLLNAKRQQKRRAANGIETYTVKPTGAYAPILHLYRASMSSPLHAMGAELYYFDPKRGDKLIADIEVLHTVGLTESGVEAKLAEILRLFSQKAGKTMTKFRKHLEIPPLQCPCRPCPLHPAPGSADVTFTV
jgi:hypothetical protein